MLVNRAMQFLQVTLIYALDHLKGLSKQKCAKFLSSSFSKSDSSNSAFKTTEEIVRIPDVKLKNDDIFHIIDLIKE